jgi:hypothetical protein
MNETEHARPPEVNGVCREEVEVLALAITRTSQQGT